jgi:hypothetical protein
MLIFLSSLRGASCFVDSAGQVDKFRRRYGSRQPSALKRGADVPQ